MKMMVGQATARRAAYILIVIRRHSETQLLLISSAPFCPPFLLLLNLLLIELLWTHEIGRIFRDLNLICVVFAVSGRTLGTSRRQHVDKRQRRLLLIFVRFTYKKPVLVFMLIWLVQVRLFRILGLKIWRIFAAKEAYRTFWINIKIILFVHLLFKQITVCVVCFREKVLLSLFQGFHVNFALLYSLMYG